MATDCKSVAPCLIRAALLLERVATRTREETCRAAGPPRRRSALVQKGSILEIRRVGVPWYHLSTAHPDTRDSRLAELAALHGVTHKGMFAELLGQSLEIAAFRALQAQTTLTYFGNYPDLDAHDDSTKY
jgi:hypothetical protein